MKMYIIRGVSGTGKTTRAREIQCMYPAVDRPVHFEADQFFTSHTGEYRFDTSLLPQAHEWCRLSVLRTIRTGEAVIVSNTFTTFKEIIPYLDLARAYGYEVEVISLTKEWGSIHNVPEITLQRQRDRFVPHGVFVSMLDNRG
jgi:predicted ABC-type ATPase